MKFKKMVDEFNALLELDRKIIGVKFHKDRNEYEKGQGQERRAMTSYCTAVRDAMDGKKLKLKVENFACGAAAVACGLCSSPDIKESSKERVDMGTHKTQKIGEGVSSKMVYIEDNNYGVTLMPLEDYKSDPDIVLIVARPFQMMRLSQAYAFNYGHLDNIRFSGMQAICQELTSFPYVKQKVNISVMCSGTRMLSQWTDNEMGMGIPIKYLDGIFEGLKATVNPLERNNKKEIIEKKYKNLETKLDIIYNQNYDDGYYVGVEQSENTK